MAVCNAVANALGKVLQRFDFVEVDEAINAGVAQGISRGKHRAALGPAVTDEKLHRQRARFYSMPAASWNGA